MWRSSKLTVMHSETVARCSAEACRLVSPIKAVILNVDLLGQRQSAAAGLGQTDDFLKPVDAGGLDVQAIPRLARGNSGGEEVYRKGA